MVNPSCSPDGAPLDAVNQDFARYDQVRKIHTYRLAESADESEFDHDYQVKTCDMSLFFAGGDEGKAEFARQLHQALREIGFAILTGHGVDPRLYEELEAEVVKFFETSSLETKMKFRAARHGSVSQGYFPIRETSDIHPDLVEGWVFCRRAFDLDGSPDFDASRFWPDPAAEARFRRLVQAHEQLFLPLTQSIFRGLGCDPHAYDEKLTRTNFGLRLNYYPVMDDAADRSGAGRLLGHEDVDLFTILPASTVEGLQVWNHQSGKWVRLDAPRGSIVINTGDYLQRITNDILPSTTHRVGKPQDGTHRSQVRVSLPMAVYVWEDEVLDVLEELRPTDYEPIKAIVFHTRSTSKFYGDDYAVKE